jgi:peptidoglycan/LPS O-acetylase OafA/YrhL
VVAWHFIHGPAGYPVSFGAAPYPFVSFLDEGYVGVALFMCLSGYLFAKLLNGKDIDYGAFLWNRMVRLLPLLSLVVITVGFVKAVEGFNYRSYFLEIPNALIFPWLPNGGWSITTEFHFYLILPLFLWMLRRSRFLPFSFVFAAIGLRAALFYTNGSVQYPAYWTIIGRIDQFALGMMAYHCRTLISGKHVPVAGMLIVYSGIYCWFDRAGGFYGTHDHPIWIVMPTIDAFALSCAIAWYDNSFAHGEGPISRAIAKVGDYSYSIYLLHTFVVFKAATLVNAHVMDLGNFYVALIWASAFLLAMMPIGYLSFRFIESPFYRFRRRYIRERAPGSGFVGEPRP